MKKEHKYKQLNCRYRLAAAQPTASKHWRRGHMIGNIHKNCWSSSVWFSS